MAKRFDILTRPNMRKLSAGQKLAEHGIRFEKLENGDGRFSVWFRAEGSVVHRVIGLESEGFTRTHAEEFIEQTKSDARKGELNLPKGRKAHLSFKKAQSMYQDRLEQSNGKDMKNKKRQLRDHLEPFFGSKQLDKITTFDIERYKKHRADQGASAGTINRELAVISHLQNRALEWGWIKAKTFAVKKLPEGQGRITYLTEPQCHRLLKAAMDHQFVQIYPFIRIGLDTGMRSSEILTIRIENIHIDKNEIYLPKAKAGDRFQPISRGLADYLRSLIGDKTEGWLFPSIGTRKSKTGHTTSMRKAWSDVVKAAGLEEGQVVRHTLRHTAITHLVQAGVDLPTVKQISGHKTLQMVERYSHRNSDHVRQAMDKLSERLVKNPASRNRNATETKKGSDDENVETLGAPGRTRTGTSLRTTDFKSLDLKLDGT
jgi:integrase